MKKFLKNAFLYILIISLSYAFYVLIHLFKLNKIEPYLKYDKKLRQCKFLYYYDYKYIAKASRKLSSLIPKKQRCLLSSLVLKLLFNLKGIPSKICIGVRKKDKRLRAHAWIALDNKIINIGDNVQKYLQLKEIE